MKRRDFIKSAGLFAFALGAGGTTVYSSDKKKPSVAITIDDFNIYDSPTMTGAARNQAILDALRRYDLQAAAFVNGKFIEKESNLALLKLWNERKHIIANHTYSHWYYPRADLTKGDLQKYTDDVLRNEKLLKQFSAYRKYFRFPFLKEGNSVEQRDAMRKFLKENGYRNAHVTIDASDWYIDDRLRARLKNDPKADVAPYREFYLNHIWERAEYYDNLSLRVLGRSVKHTLLIHHNILNAFFLGDLLQMFERKKWKLIDAAEAFKDPVFSSEPNIAPAGESIVWALAKESGKFEKDLRYPAEDGKYEKPKMDALGL